MDVYLKEDYAPTSMLAFYSFCYGVTYVYDLITKIGEDIYYMECRCGGEYTLEAEDVRDSKDNTWIVPCSTCTLGLKITRAS
eukprot:m.52988 g.52988  ORF g.52988 m.52988 type:complete len:82 (-) comp12746_c0_seq2:983-1228(-)